MVKLTLDTGIKITTLGSIALLIAPLFEQLRNDSPTEGYVIASLLILFSGLWCIFAGVLGSNSVTNRNIVELTLIFGVIIMLTSVLITAKVMFF